MVSKTTRYALRVLVALSGSRGNGAMGSRGLAQDLGIPGPYLGKILSALSRNDIVESSRGRGGGYRLNRRPEAVSLKTVLQLFEPEALERVCIVGNPDCPGASCARHKDWQAAYGRFLALMEETTIADIA
jgi:Rrf2 family protein